MSRKRPSSERLEPECESDIEPELDDEDELEEPADDGSTGSAGGCEAFIAGFAQSTAGARLRAGGDETGLGPLLL
jgi:hypothetical protein